MTPKFPRQAVPGRLRQENQQSEVIFSHAVGLRAAWTTFHPVSKNNRKTDSKNIFSTSNKGILSSGTKKHLGDRHCGTCLSSLALRRLSQEDCKFKAKVDYLASSRPIWTTQ